MELLVALRPARFETRRCHTCPSILCIDHPLSVVQYTSTEAAIRDGWRLTRDPRWCPPDRAKVWVCPGCVADAPSYTLDGIRALYGLSLKTDPIDASVGDSLVLAGRRGRHKLWRLDADAPEPPGGWKEPR